MRRKNVLSTTMHSFFGLALVSIVWVIVGFTLAFGTDVPLPIIGGGFIGGLEFAMFNGVGQAPSEWNPVSEGSAIGSVTTLGIGEIDLDAVRAALASFTPPPDTGGPTLPAVGESPFASEFTVRVVATADGVPTPAVDRRVFTSAEDPSLRDGFPKRMGTGGEGEQEDGSEAAHRVGAVEART